MLGTILGFLVVLGGAGWMVGRKSCAEGFRVRAEENWVEVVQEVADIDGFEETNIVEVEAGNSVVGWEKDGCCTVRCWEGSSSTAAWSGSTARSSGGSTLTKQQIGHKLQ